MAKIAIFVFLAACVAISTAASVPGVKDFLGNYFDPYTNQYSSALTGKVYNTLPVAAPVVPAYVPPVAPIVAPAAPYYSAYAYPYAAYPYAAAAAYVSPLLKK